MTYGRHMTLDLKNCNPDKLKDLEFVSDLLDSTPSKIGMTKITQPYVFKYTDGVVPSDWGITGFVVIAESHISIHTYPDKRYVFIDVFSCNDFNEDVALSIFKEAFETQDYSVYSVLRGKDFPRG